MAGKILMVVLWVKVKVKVKVQVKFTVEKAAKAQRGSRI
jgi:hypothetical protein